MSSENQLNEILEKLNFTKGRIWYGVTPNLKSTRIADRLIISFEHQNFNYFDPLYGEIEAKGDFNTFFETLGIDNKIPFSDIFDLQNKPLWAESAIVCG